MISGEDTTIFTDYLAALGVKHTKGYSDMKFRTMPFQTMFGMKKLLESYGVESCGIELGESASIEQIPVPFIAQLSNGYVIVSDVSGGMATYLSQSQVEKVDCERLRRAMTGRVLVASPSDNAGEPEYESHRFTEVANRAKKWVLLAACLALFVYAFVSNGVYRHLSTALLALIDVAGLYVTWLLVQKSAHIKNRHADAVCSVVEAGGCDDILSTTASKFFGIFGWSEVGFAYFSVSLLCLLMFPQCIGALALCNVLCLPFSFWSVWYQRFKAKTWCTLCLCVQSMLWLLFFCYLGGGWLKYAWPVGIYFVVLCATYLAVMLGLNAIMPLLDRNNKD